MAGFTCECQEMSFYEIKFAVKATVPLVRQDTAGMLCGQQLQHLSSGESSYALVHACCGCQVQSYVGPRIRTLHMLQMLYLNAHAATLKHVTRPRPNGMFCHLRRDHLCKLMTVIALKRAQSCNSSPLAIMPAMAVAC